jgi:hypothetical protein
MIDQGLREAMQGTFNVIAKLATSTASDRGTIARLTTTNAKLASQLETAQAYIKTLKEESVVLKEKIKPTWQGQHPAKLTSNNNYCWSHCYQVHRDHTSATCKTKKDGHKDTTTKNNTMGGVALMRRGS